MWLDDVFQRLFPRRTPRAAPPAERRRGPGDRRLPPAGPYGAPSYATAGGATRPAHAVPLDPRVSYELYRQMRSSFPVLDVAISKLVRLAGHVVVEAAEEERRELEGWLAHVQVNALGRGFQMWLESHLDQAMQYGRAVGEIVPNRARTDVIALTNLDPVGLEFHTVPEHPLELQVVQWQGGRRVTIPRPYAVVSAHNPQGDTPHGVSLYRSLPLVAEALSVIENATVQVWRRMGAPPYHVNWQPPSGFSDPDGTLTDAFMSSLQSAFTDAMAARAAGEVRDFFSSGDVRVSVVGGADQALELREPFRAFAEQVVAATGLPPWMFGFGWSTTERMSVQQADMLVANIEGIRRSVQPAVEQVIELRQRLAGRPAPRRLTWSPVNLRDLTEATRTQLWEQQARALRVENAHRMWALGFWDQARAAAFADPDGGPVARAYETPPPVPADRHPANLPTSEAG